MNWGSENMPDMGDFDTSNIPNMGGFDMNNMPQGNMQFEGVTPDGTNPGGSIGSASGGTFISEDAVFLIVSVAVLLAGLVFAAVFKRRK